MNITEYSKNLKSKVAQIMTNWDKLTINQLEYIERIVNNIMPQEEKEKMPTKTKTGRRRNLMNEEVYKEVMNLRMLGWSWGKIAKRFGYASEISICSSVSNFKRKHPNVQSF